MYYVYILTNRTNGVMYIGVTNNLKRRVYEHKNGLVEGFTKKYRTHKLVYFEIYRDPKNAILREKALKGLLRKRKNELVEATNPNWTDLSIQLFAENPCAEEKRSFASLEDDSKILTKQK